ncbi:abortive infection family protein [Trinickia diaoshuihuensis]|uniref:abortive infection family protein n=1 Tax=Trinickia diaoshuihuensis TaxID=2292265 RepID=UPI000E28359F|nr:abortive infection family protein [Trinickia diaoshuihuensis]
MKYSIKSLSAQHKRVKAKQVTLFEKAHELSAALNEEFGASIYASGADTMLNPTGPGEGTYGRLAYDGEELRVIYRTTDEDLHDAANGVPEDEKGYHVRPLSSCSSKWLDRLLAADSVDSLFANISTLLNEREARVDQSLAALDKILAAESAGIEAQMAASLAEFNNDTLNHNWAAVLDATHLETADALTRSSRMLEAVCTAILNGQSVALPADKSLSPLLKACMKCLQWPAAKEAQEDVKQLTSGVQSICNAVGTLRTHFGTAHGASSHLPPLDPEFGILAKNACATAAIFLLSRHKQSGTTTDDAAAT